MIWDHIIKNGTITTATSNELADVYIKDGKILAISSEPIAGEAKEITDATGKHVLPGLIDTHVHSRDPGNTYKEDFYHSTIAAAMGGITMIFEMPNTTPPVNNQENFVKQVNNLSSKANVNFGLWGICLGDLNLSDLKALNEAGVIGFKFFWGYAVRKGTYELVYNFDPNDQNVIPPPDDGQVYKMIREVAETGKIFAVHAENNELVQALTSESEARQDKSYDNFIKGRPDLVEETTIKTGISMANHTGARFHVLHITSELGVNEVRRAQVDNNKITCETCPHYLFLNAEDYEEIGPMMKVYPPVKHKNDQESLWRAIDDGTISIVCSDHAPHTFEEKNGDLWSIPAGMCGVETLAPLMLNAVHESRISLQKFVELLSTNPAKQFGLYPNKGSLNIGSDADITIVDLNKAYTISREKLHSISKITAYDGFDGVGYPVQTIVNGKTVMKNGEMKQYHTGKIVYG